jgi:4-aminobutyrate aminotransferase/(S)-3-amino-2-methylpropionate transaminase
MFAEHAKGSSITDVDGRTLLDFATGISVLNVGHGHPRVIDAILTQAQRLLHSGTPVMLPRVYVELAKRLCELTPGEFAKKAFFVNSGAEAVENAVKVVRQATGRPAIFSFDNAFHGRTLLTLALTGKNAPYKQHFGPYPPAIHHLPYPNPYRRPGGLTTAAWTQFCIDAIRDAFRTAYPPDLVAGILVEPVQGEGGFIVPPPDFLPALARLCREHDIPLIVDEIQTGFARTGKMFAIEHSNVAPDVMVLAKSLGGGLPLAGIVGRANLMDAAEPGALGGTFGGNPVACAAALAVIDVLIDENLAARAQVLGQATLRRMTEWYQAFTAIGDVRGLGAMVAMEFVKDRESRTPAPDITNQILKVCHQSGLLLLKAGLYDNVIRLIFPLSISDQELQEGLDILEASLREVLA